MLKETHHKCVTIKGKQAKKKIKEEKKSTKYTNRIFIGDVKEEKRGKKRNSRPSVGHIPNESNGRSIRASIHLSTLLTIPFNEQLAHLDISSGLFEIL